MHYCLFDIDGTLVDTNGAGRTAMLLALESEFEPDRPVSEISTLGRTDRGIIVDLFQFYGIELSPQNWERLTHSYVQHLPAALSQSQGAVLPGISGLLELLAQRDDTVVGLLTGNLRAGAERKLQHYGLWERFTFGEYGDQHADRDDVARDALQSLVEHTGLPIDPDQIWVIGDTPADVQCGRAIGARTVGVGTGAIPLEKLAAAQPDHLFEDFTSPERFHDMLW